MIHNDGNVVMIDKYSYAEIVICDFSNNFRSLYMKGNSNVMLSMCNFMSQTHNVITQQDGSLTINSCNFINNTGPDSGSVLYVQPYGTVYIYNSTFNNNRCTGYFFGNMATI